MLAHNGKLDLAKRIERLGRASRWEAHPDTMLVTSAIAALGDLSAEGAAELVAKESMSVGDDAVIDNRGAGSDGHVCHSGGGDELNLVGGRFQSVRAG